MEEPDLKRQPLIAGLSPPTHQKSEHEESAARRAGSALLGKVRSPEFWLRRLPFLAWLPTYNLESFFCDCVAGLTTALTVIPQGIGYMPLAGLPLQYGLYASIMPGFIYCLFGTTKETTVGPTAVNAIMSYNYAGPVPYKAVTFGFISGLVEFVMGLLNLGLLVKFVSQPVISAFSTAVAFQVITSQLKGLFGMTYPGRGFVKIWYGFFLNITTIKMTDMGASFITFAILFFIKKLKECQRCEGDDPAAKRAIIVKRIKWFFGISANCILVLLGSVVAWILLNNGLDVLDLTGEVESGLPHFQLPWQFGLNLTAEAEANSTSSATSPLDLLEIVQELGMGVVMMPLVSILQHLAIAKHYAGTKKMEASQEMVALGLCQVFGSCTGSLPITASFGRSAVNSSSGVRTPFGGVVTGLIIVLACAVLSPYLAYIPTSVLSAVIIFSMFSTIAYQLPLQLWRSQRSDLLPCLITFSMGLFVSVESGLIVGTLCHCALCLFFSSRIHVSEESTQDHKIIKFDRALYYPSVDCVRSKLTGSLLEGQSLLIDMSCVTEIDFTSANSFVATVTALGKKNIGVHISEARPNVKRSLLAQKGGDSLAFYSSLEEAGLSLKV